MVEGYRARASRPQEDPLAEAPIACHELDHDGNVVWVNEAECRLLGLERSEILGRPIWEFVSPGERETSRIAVFRKLAGGDPLPVFERGYIRPDGVSLVLEIHEHYCHTEDGTVSGLRSFLLDITRRKQAEEALLNAQGELESRIRERTEELELAIDFVRREMEERRIAEKEQRKLETQMQSAQRMESVGVLAGGVAHEFNNLLTSIMGYASMAAMDLPDSSRARSNIEHVLAAAKSAADLTQQMLAYSGRGRFVLEPLDLSHTVDSTARLLDSMISKKARVKLYLPGDLPRIEADEGQLRQIVINLATNASDALEERPGEVSIVTGMQWLEMGELPSLEAGHVLPAGLYVYLEVSDTGTGMDVETLPRIFDPFFSTKFAGRGLGLAAVMGIVRSHKGCIKVTSTIGQGTTMRVLFPALPEGDEAVKRAGQANDPLLWRATGTVLVVEDEEPIRALVRAILERAGLTVLAAADGTEGLTLFREYGSDIRAVLLDLTMPGMDGAEVLRRIQQLRPEVRVLLCTGYSAQQMDMRLQGVRPAGFLRKPYVPAELIEQLRAVW
jgi:two-component system, cell cycle sensor histidine kinase and response regulator CckA